MSEKSTIDIITEWDIVAARQIGRNVAKEIGFGTVDQARITTAISELARNIYLYARAGEIVIEAIEEEDKKGIAITATDKGPGIDNVRKVMEGSAVGGLGAGLPGVRRLMDHIEIQSLIGRGTIVKVEKWL